MTHLKHDNLLDYTNFFFTSSEILPKSFQTEPSYTVLFSKRATSQNRRKSGGLNNFLSCSKFLMFSTLVSYQKLDQRSDEFHLTYLRRCSQFSVSDYKMASSTTIWAFVSFFYSPVPTHDAHHFLPLACKPLQWWDSQMQMFPLALITTETFPKQHMKSLNF